MTGNSSGTERIVAARLERLPRSSWHVRMRLVIGSATFFDAFDSIAIASALPLLVSLWSLSPQQVGLMISAGFAGQAIGAIIFGRLAERVGRIKAATISIAIFTVTSFLCAASNSYYQLLICRVIQGVGLGGEVPVAATYINEIAGSEDRGRFFLLYECVFLLGILVSSLAGAYIIPNFGYRWLFILGGLPACLIVFLRRVCPESPRWLASKGRYDEADDALRAIEHRVAGGRQLPPYRVSSEASGTTLSPRQSWNELFEPPYLGRTIVVWVLWFSSFLVSYGLSTWLPTIYRTTFGISIQSALLLSVIGNLLSLVGGVVCALLIDRMGRRAWLTYAFFVAFCPLIILAISGAGSLATAVALTAAASAAINTITITLYLYTPEIYPTRMRAVGTSWATFWTRIATLSGAYGIGLILPLAGLTGVFVLFSSVALAGGLVSLLGTIETRGKVLEDISP
jgi:putative MFS transporter